MGEPLEAAYCRARYSRGNPLLMGLLALGNRVGIPSRRHRLLRHSGKGRPLAIV